MLRIRRTIRLGKTLNRSSISPVQRWAKPLTKQTLRHALHLMGPTLTALLFAGIGSGIAHAQGTMDFSGAQTLMGTFNNRFAYVSVSRASHDAQIYTNNAATLTASLSHDVSKASAVDFGKGQHSIANAELKHTTPSSKTPAAGLGLAL